MGRMGGMKSPQPEEQPPARRKPGRPTKAQAEEMEGLKEKWLAAYRLEGWTAACDLVGVGYSTPSSWKHRDVIFREAFEEAQPAVADRMERLAEEVIQGRREMDRSATLLLIFRLKALRPHMYRDRVSLEHTGAGGGAIKVEQGDAGRGAQLLEEWAGRLRQPTGN